MSTGSEPNLTGVNLLLVFIYGGIFVICVIIFLIRAARRSARFSQNTHDSDFYANKKLKQLINENLDKRVHYLYEPQLLDRHDERLHTFLEQDNYTYKYNYMYRMKTLELMNDIDMMLTDISKELHRPVGKSLLQHFQDVKSHSSGCLRSVRSSQIQQLASMYQHARYSGETYSKKEYDKFLEVANNIISVIGNQPQLMGGSRRHLKSSNSMKKKVLQWQESVSSDNVFTSNPPSVRGSDSVFAPLVEHVEMVDMVTTPTALATTQEQLHGTNAATDSANTLESQSDNNSNSFSNLNLSFEQSSRPLLSSSSVKRRNSNKQTKV